MGLEAHAATSKYPTILLTSTAAAGAESGAVTAPTSPGEAPEHPPSSVLSAVLSLLRQLPAAERAKIADALNNDEGG